MHPDSPFLTNAQALGRYRSELIEVGIDDPAELADLVRDAALYLLNDGGGLGVKAES